MVRSIGLCPRSGAGASAQLQPRSRLIKLLPAVGNSTRLPSAVSAIGGSDSPLTLIACSQIHCQLAPRSKLCTSP